MTIDLYYLPPSPPSRAVILLAKALGIHLNLKVIDVSKGEQLSPEFIKVTFHIYFIFLYTWGYDLEIFGY